MVFKDKKVLVLGAGISGISAAHVLNQLGACVTLSDAKAKTQIKHDVSGLADEGIVLQLGQQDETVLAGMDYVVLSPGISIYLPLVEAAIRRNIAVISEIEVAYAICKAPIVAITGTNGKTTTTTLAGEILKQTGRSVVVGGNIGIALSQEVLGADPNSIVVAEISSFQLEGIRQFHPHIAAILNLTPDHIDRHRSFANYQAAKERIFENQTPQDYLILNYDDPQVRAMAQRAQSQIFYFSRLSEMPAGIFVKDGSIHIKWQGHEVVVCRIQDIQIKGGHNVENALAACAAGYLCGVSTTAMMQVLREFPGVEHRIEPITTIDGVAYYNDSKATNPESAIKALEAFPGHIILIAGGRDKKTDLTEFMTLIRKKADHLILLGEAQERFQEAAQRQGIQNIHVVKEFADAVNLAHSLARPPQVVLLSPACSSYDMFDNYEERGRTFKQLVRSLA